MKRNIKIDKINPITFKLSPNEFEDELKENNMSKLPLYEQFIAEELQDLPQQLTSNDVIKVLLLFQEWLIKNNLLKDVQ